MSSSTLHPRVLFGGTFDPVHKGHIAIAMAAADSLSIPDVALMPCYSPPHKIASQASTRHRVAMLERAIADCNAQNGTQLWLERWESDQPVPSWTTKTLEHFRTQDERPIILVMGMDAFCTLSEWRESHRLLELANLWIAQRDETLPQPSSTEGMWLRRYRVDSPQHLMRGTAQLFVAKTPRWNCSSSQIRGDIAAEKETIDVPPVVLDYIKKHELYRDALPPNRSQ